MTMFQNCAFLYKNHSNLNKFISSTHGFWGYAEE